MKRLVKARDYNNHRLLCNGMGLTLLTNPGKLRHLALPDEPVVYLNLSIQGEKTWQ